MAFDDATLGQISDEIKADPAFTEISKGDLNSTVKNLIDSQKTLGRAILLPDEKDPDDKKVEKLNSVYEKLGRPKAHTDYKVEEIFGKDSGVTTEKAERYLKAFHEAGLSTRQANRLVSEYMADAAESGFSQEKAIEALSVGDADNKIEGWGEKVEANVGIAKRALAKFDSDGRLSAFLEASGVGNQPEVIRFLYSIGATLEEDTTPAREETPRGGAMGKETAQAKIAEIMNNREHPYYDKKKAGHAEAVAEVAKLNAILHGNKVETVTGTY